MKLAAITALFMFSVSAFAMITEVECEAVEDSKTIYLEIEESFPTGSAFQRATLEVGSVEEGVESFNYTVTARRSPTFSRLNYTGAGLRLEVALWPDRKPQWGRTYRAVLNSTDLGNKYLQVDCRFPNIF